MSPYLHFGQISPVEIALAVRAAKAGDDDDRGAYLEELIVRRELAMNHVFYTEGYDAYDKAVPDWARKTLAEHAEDPRPHTYTEDAARGRRDPRPLLERRAGARCARPATCTTSCACTGARRSSNGRPRPKEGFARTLRLNNRYFLDGRDPNSFTNVAWVYGLHDRPWAEAQGLRHRALPERELAQEVRRQGLCEGRRGALRGGAR